MPEVYLPVFLSSALEQPVLLDGASWSCTRPSQRCGATTMQSMQTVQSMQFLAQEAKPRSRAAVRSRMRRSRYNEHDAGSKRPGRLCGARMLNPTRTPHERAQEATAPPKCQSQSLIAAFDVSPMLAAGTALTRFTPTGGCPSPLGSDIPLLA